MSLCNSEEAVFTFSSAGVNSGTHPDLLLCLLGCQVLDTHQRPVCLHPGERERERESQREDIKDGRPPPLYTDLHKDIHSDYKATGRRANKYET